MFLNLQKNLFKLIITSIITVSLLYMINTIVSAQVIEGAYYDESSVTQTITQTVESENNDFNNKTFYDLDELEGILQYMGDVEKIFVGTDTFEDSVYIENKEYDNTLTRITYADGTVTESWSWDNTSNHDQVEYTDPATGYSGTLYKDSNNYSSVILSSVEEDGIKTEIIKYTGYYSGTVYGEVTYNIYAYRGTYQGVVRKVYYIEKNYGDPTESNGASVGEPVNIVTGNYYASKTDTSITDVGMPLEIKRYYNSLDDEVGVLGAGWRLNYDTQLEIDNQTGNVSVIYPNGRRILYKYDSSSDEYLRPKNTEDYFTKNSDNTYELLVDNEYLYKYNSSGQLTSITDENGNSTTIQYDANAYIDKVIGAEHTLDLTVQSGKLTAITDDLGRTIEYTYSGNNLIEVKTLSGGKINYQYNSYGITSASDENGNTYITNIYDEFGRVIKQYDAFNNITEYSYDDLYLENTYKVLSTGKTEKYKYNEQYYITKITYDDETYEAYTYDEWGNRNSVRDRNGNTTNYTYDISGNLLSVTTPSPNSYTTNYTYDSNNNLIEVTKPDGVQTILEYDTNNNLVKITSHIDETTDAITTFTYDSYGRLLTQKDAENNVTSYEYNDGSNPIRVTDPENNVVEYGYDNVGRVTTITTSYGTTTLAYDNDNNIEKITDPEGNITRKSYDLVGNLVELILPEQYNETTDDGIGYTYVYDEMEDLIKVIDPLSSVTRYMYNAEGKQTKEINANNYNLVTDNGEGYQYEYDSNDRLVKVINPSGEEARIKYDPVGNLIKIIDANNYNETTDDGPGIEYAYDELNRLVQTKDTFGNITNQYIYDSNNRIIESIDANGYSTYYEYNLAGWLIEQRESVKEESDTIYYRITKNEYDKTGKIVKEKTSQEYVTQTSNPTTWDEVTYTYDKNGNVKSVTDSQGSYIEYQYDSVGNTTQIEYKIDDQTTNVTKFTYDSAGRVTKETKEYAGEDLIGNQTGLVLAETLYEYDKNGNTTKITTPEGYITEYEYDDANRLITVNEQVTADTLNENTTTVSIESPRNTVYPNNQYEYQVNIKPDEDTNITALSIELEYDTRIFEIAEVNSYAGNITINTDTLGKIYITATGTNYTTEQILAGIIVNVKDSTTGEGYITVSQTSNYIDNTGQHPFSQGIGRGINSNIPDMNEDNQVKTDDFTLTALLDNVQITDPTYHQKYDIDGSQIIDTSDLDYITEWLFDDNKVLDEQELTRFTEKYTNSVYTTDSTQTTRTTTYEYDKVGNITKITDANGNSSEYTYDVNNNLIKYTDKEGATYRTYYDEVGNIIKEILPENYNQQTDDGVGTTYIYDSMNRIVQIIDALGNVSQSYVYNDLGQVTEITDAEGYTTEYTYDIGGRITSITKPEAKDKGETTAAYTYDAKDNIITYTDGEGNTTTYVRDMWGNATKITDANGIDTYYEYNYAGNITKTIDGKGNTTNYTYNSLNQIKTITDPLNQTITYKYDKEGRLREETDRKGQTITYQYNSDHNLTSKAVGAEEEIYLYNKDGSLLAAINDKIINTYQYTPNGYLESKTRNGETILNYQYNKNGNVTSVIDSNNKATNYTYDTLGRIQNVIDETTTLATYSYNIDNTIDQIMYNNGIQIDYTYDKDNNITALTNKKADGTNITSFNYTYDNNGNRLTETENGQTTSYTYDNLNRLAEVEYPTSQIETFTYDNAGNRLTRELGTETTTYTYDANNRLIESITNQITTNYTYDNNGNLLTETKNGEIITNIYDGFNRLIETTNPDGTWQENIYDALGLRVGTIENGLSYEFTYDRGNIINETNAKGETISRSIRGYNLIAQDNVEDGLSYYLNNAHGDIVNLVDIEGNIQNYYNYDAFGNLQEAIVTVQNRFLYSGEQLDEITGDYYLRARYYSPEIGRFTQEDTYRGDGLNLYAYVANNPVNYIDPSGHRAVCDGGAVDTSSDDSPTYWSVTRNFRKGLWDSLVSTWDGLDFSDQHIIKTFEESIELLKDPKELIKDSKEFAKLIGTSIADEFKEYVVYGNADTISYYIGKKALDIALAFVGTKGIDKLIKVSKVKKIDNVADDVIEGANNLAKYGDEFGKMGKYVESPNVKVNWDAFAEHGWQRMEKRGVTQDMVESWVQNGKALSQNGGDKFAIITQDGVAVVSKEGKLITTWGSDNFDDAMKGIVEQLYGK